MDPELLRDRKRTISGEQKVNKRGKDRWSTPKEKKVPLVEGKGK